MINLLNKIFKKIEKIELDNKKIFLIILSCLLIIYFDFSFLIKKQLQGIRNLRPEIIRLRKDLDTLTGDLAKMQDFKNEQTRPGKKAPSGIKQIISDEQVVSLLQNISDVANKNNVQILQMRPSKVAQDLKQDKTAITSNFIPLSINLDVSCDYHSLGRFINDLENAEVFIAVQNMKIASGQAEYLKQRANLELKSYVKK